MINTSPNESIVICPRNSLGCIRVNQVLELLELSERGEVIQESGTSWTLKKVFYETLTAKRVSNKDIYSTKLA